MVKSRVKEITKKFLRIRLTLLMRMRFRYNTLLVVETIMLEVISNCMRSKRFSNLIFIRKFRGNSRAMLY